MVGSRRVGMLENVSYTFQLASTGADFGLRFELAVGWFGNYDGYDLASLSLLSHGPPVRTSPFVGSTSSS